MGDGLGVVLAILVMVNIALQVWHMWPSDDGEDLDVSNPVGFRDYNPDDHEDDEEPWECHKRPRGPHVSDASWGKLQREETGD